MLKAFLHFSRPHTVIGTTLSAAGLFTVAWAFIGGGMPDLGLLGWAVVACLSANIYIVGLNQIMDIDIDRINKPYLPLASGDFSLVTGWGIVGFCLVVALVVAFAQGPFLSVTVVVSLLIGTAYSVPPIRLKKYTFWAAACIFTVRGVVVNLFLYLHFQFQMTGLAVVPVHVWALTIFVFGMSLVIAWFKDIPDMEGDRRFRIATLSLRLGPHRVFSLGLGLLVFCYLGMIGVGLLKLPAINPTVLIVVHAALLLLLLLVGRRTDPTQHQPMTRFYLFVWTLFFAEYIAFPIACL